MQPDKNFFGELVGFYGVVEDRMDPVRIGRVRVRIAGVHTSDKTLIPTSALPWAETQGSGPASSGVGRLAKFVEGSFVWGFFKDGYEGQEPFVVGSWFGVPGFPATPNKGFSDPRTNFDSAPKKVSSISDPADGSGVTLQQENQTAFPWYTQEPDSSRQARNEDYPGLKNKLRVTNVPTASHASTGLSGDSASSGASFSEPEDAYGAVYPYNDVLVSESGHVFEIDDTPSAERINLQHRSGSYYEQRPDGSVIRKSNKTTYDFTRENKHEHVNGRKQVTIDKGMQLLVNASESGESLTIEIGSGGHFNLTIKSGNLNINVLKGNLNKRVAGDLNEIIEGNVTRVVQGNVTQTVAGNVTETVSGNDHKTIEGDMCQTVNGSQCETTIGDKTETIASTGTYQASGSMTIAGNPLQWNP